jgi:hypothetical protein
MNTPNFLTLCGDELRSSLRSFHDRDSRSESKRKLTTEEIETICNSIPLNKHIDRDVATAVRDNVLYGIRNQLQRIVVYPEILPKLQQQILQSYETSFIHPGEGVGCVAASSIGEVATQASLNSFHSSGLSKANLSSGIPRIKELLNASKMVKTPSCSIYLKPEVGDLKDLFIVKEFCDKELIYHDIRSLLSEMTVDHCPVLTDYEKHYYNFFQVFYEDFEITNWRIRIVFSEELLYKCKKTMSYITGCIK